MPPYQGQKSWMWIPAETLVASESLIVTEEASLAHHGPAALGMSLHFLFSGFRLSFDDVFLRTSGGKNREMDR